MKNKYKTIDTAESYIKPLINFFKQRIIEELEDIKSTLKTKPFSEHCIEEIDKRIKELKQ